MNTSKIKWYDFFKFKGSSLYLGSILVCIVLTSYLGAILPSTIANLSTHYEHEALFYYSLKKLAVIFIATYLIRVGYQLIINVYIRELIQNVRFMCYSRWLLQHDIYDSRKDNSKKKSDFPLGEVLARIINDTESIRELVTSGTLSIFIDIFFVVSCLIGFINLNEVTGFFLSGAEVFATFVLFWGSKYMRKIFLNVRLARASVSRAVSNTVGGVAETYFNDHNNYASKKCEKEFDDFLHKQLISNVWDAGYYSIAESLYPILLALVVFIFPFSGIVQGAVIFAVVDLIQRSIGPIKDISGKIASIQRAITGVERMTEFVDHFSEGSLDEVSETPAAMCCDVEFKSLKLNLEGFYYPRTQTGKQFTIEDVSFEGQKGEVIGIVGLSGSGKTTVLNIISANIIPQKGTVDIELKDRTVSFPGEGYSDIRRYRELVGIVSQESHIFSDSVFFNITLEREKPEDFDQFWDWVCEKIPYFKTVWEIGPESRIDVKRLSLGQKQLMSAVRSCYLKKPVVLFDEISSGLDSELEVALREVVSLIQANSLTIVVAHRLETVVGADKILVMSDGRLTDTGNHADLIKSSKTYQEFIHEITLQTDDEDVDKK